MKRWLFLTSYLVLAVALTTFLDRPVTTFLSHSVAAVLISVIVGCWLFALWRLFRSTPISKREKFVAWLSAAAFTCGLLAVFKVGFYVYGPSWLTIFAWHGFWLTLAFAFALSARLVAPRQSFPPHTPFTVQSESPSHVTTANDA
jgi:hypothetical protein